MGVEKPLQELERNVYAGHPEAAFEYLQAILADLENDSGPFASWTTAVHSDPAVRQLFTRLAGAITHILMSARWSIGEQAFHAIVPYLEVLSGIFRLSGFGSADHILDPLVARGFGLSGRDGSPIVLELRKFLLGLSLHSPYVLRLREVVQQTPVEEQFIQGLPGQRPAASGGLLLQLGQ